MKKLLRKHSFTLVEVLIAMGICVIGICSLMVFFPVGANASRDAAMASYAANTADQLLSFAKMCIEEDSGVGGYVAFRYFTGWENPSQPGSYTKGSAKPIESTTPDTTLNDDIINAEENNIYDTNMQKSLSLILGNQQTKITTLGNTPSNTNKLFYIQFQTKKQESSEYLEDFNCFAQIYAVPIVAGEVTSNDSTTEINVPFSANLHVEISWPADLPYDKRQKRDYSLEVFKPY